MTRHRPGQEELLDEALLRAQRLDAAERLGVGLVHDLNNLLSAIMGHFDLEDPSDPEDAAATREEIRLLLERGKELTQRFLSLVEDDPTSHVQEFDLGERVKKLMVALRYALRRKVTLELELHPRPIPVLIDPCQLDQILLNLVFNANDAMPEGGRMVVVTRLDGGDAVLEVQDEGVGIDPELRERLFEPYVSTKPKGEGTGIGLVICRRIAERADGTLVLEPADEPPGQPGAPGTVARLRLPRRD